MIEVHVLKEIRSYKTYLIGHFTTRQIICGAVAIAGVYACHFIQTKLIGLETPIGFLMFLSAIPGVAFGWLKPYGLPLENFLKTAWIDNFVAPKVRPYVIENPMHDLIKEEKENDSKGKEKEKPKKIKQKDLPEEWIKGK